MSDEKKPFHNPFEALSHLRGTRSADPAIEKPKPPATNERPAFARTVRRAVVRLERRGRGGKEVTVIDHLELVPAERERLLKTLKAALGCGGTIDGDTVVLQGDQRSRLPELLS